MSRRLNQYQRRQEKRRADKISAISTLITIALFGIAYLVMQGQLDTLFYSEVLASNGTLTLEDVRWRYWREYWLHLLIAGFFVWTVVTLIVGAIMRRPYNTFEFGDREIQQLGRELQERPIDLSRISPQEFERQVARLITYQTGHTTKVIGGAGDNGVDIKVYNKDRQLVGVVQCKRYNPNKALPPMYVREMATVKRMQGVNIGYLATTAYFTEETRRLAKQLDVRLIEGRDLEHIVKKVQRAASKKPKGTGKTENPSARFPIPSPANDYTDYTRSINGMWDES